MKISEEEEGEMGSEGGLVPTCFCSFKVWNLLLFLYIFTAAAMCVANISSICTNAARAQVQQPSLEVNRIENNSICTFAL